MDRICGNGETLVRGKYMLFNNLWGAAMGSGSQCLWDAAAGGTDDEARIAWGTNWDWTGPTDSIKSYVAVVLGWHWGWAVPNTGLPTPLSAIESARSRWDFNLTETVPGPINVTYDIWLATDPDRADQTLKDEIMIWVHRGGGAIPIGSKRATVAIDGATWDLWEGPHPSGRWVVHSFVRTASADSVSLDLKDFFEFLISRGLSSSTYLIGIEAGTEVFTGAGRLDTTGYAVDVVGAEGATGRPRP
jgi:hypothetical protein